MPIQLQSDNKATKLRVARVTTGLTIKEFAKRHGLNTDRLYRVERGQMYAPLTWRPILAQALGIAQDDLFDSRGFPKIVEQHRNGLIVRQGQTFVAQRQVINRILDESSESEEVFDPEAVARAVAEDLIPATARIWLAEVNAAIDESKSFRDEGIAAATDSNADIRRQIEAEIALLQKRLSQLTAAQQVQGNRLNI